MTTSRKIQVSSTPLEGLKILSRSIYEDQRGTFARLFCEETLNLSDSPFPVRQINRSLTWMEGTVRGLHFQHHPFTDGKIVTCIRGAIFDVAVDIRNSSPTFLQWFGLELSEDDDRSLLVPAGFAHGFQTLRPNSAVLYFHSAPHAAGYEGTINALDPAINISWPLPISQRSEKDSEHPFLPDTFAGLPIP